MTRILVRGGTVVRVEGTRRADVVIDGERIEAVVEPADGDRLAASSDVVDATGLLVLPGVVDVHTHTRVASDAEPDRFFRDSVAAAHGGTTTMLAFNNPGTGSSEAAERSLEVGLREWRAATAGDAAIDVAPSLTITGRADDPVGEAKRVVDAGVPTGKAFMVYDMRLDDRRLLAVLEALGRAGGLLEVHCEDPALIDAAVDGAVAAGRTAPRDHATTRSAEAEAVAVHRAAAFAGAVDAPVHIVHLSSAAALDEVRRAKAAGIRITAETCPHYLVLTADRYDGPDSEAIRYVISPPLRTAVDRDALWGGLADGTLDIVATDHVPDRLAVEKRTPAPPFPAISNGAPGIETLLATVFGEGVGQGRISLERMVDVLSATPARRFGLSRKGAIEPGRDADLVLLDPTAERTIRSTELHHSSDYTPYEGLTVSGAVRAVYLRGSPIVEGGHHVGNRGDGRFVERGHPG